MTPPLSPRVMPLLLADLRAAASYLEDLAEEASWPRDVRLAHQHAARLWCAVQAVQRLVEDQADRVTPGVAP